MHAASTVIIRPGEKSGKKKFAADFNSAAGSRTVENLK